MKALFGLLALLVLFGCAGSKTLEELEVEAMQSGDWSAVERREKRLAERAAHPQNQCPTTEIVFCEYIGSSPRCYCSQSFGRVEVR